MASAASVRALLAAAVATAAFFLFAHNSGYGYDALEYLVIGREVANGTSLYSFAPSKGPGIYAFVAAWSWIVGPITRVQVALVVAFVATLLAWATRRVASRFTPPAAAWLAACITWLSALCMEQNFLETEGFVLGSGLVAIACIVREARIDSSWQRSLAAGVALGIGALFKAVALAYAPGLAIGAMLCPSLSWRLRLLALACLGVGVAIPLVVAGISFAGVGDGDAYWRWSFVFPLTQYPGDSEFATKTLIKCSWLIAVFSWAAVHVASRRGWRILLADRVFLVLAVMSCCALLPLLKSQASHYVFPSAGCLALLLARALALVPPPNAMRLRAAIGGVVLATIALAAFARPDALRRLAHWNDFAEDARASRALDVADPTHGPLLALGDTGYLLHVSGRRPVPTPLVNSHAQPAFALRLHPRLLTEALADPALRVVVWDPGTWRPDHASFPLAEGSVELSTFRGELEARFERNAQESDAIAVWQRR